MNVHRSTRTGSDRRIGVEAYTRFKPSMNCVSSVTKKLALLSLVGDADRSEDESGVSSSDDERRKWRVSGIKIIREVPNIRRPRPRSIGIHGDRSINVEANEGAKSAAKRAALPPNKKIFAL